MVLVQCLENWPVPCCQWPAHGQSCWQSFLDEVCPLWLDLVVLADILLNAAGKLMVVGRIQGPGLFRNLGAEQQALCQAVALGVGVQLGAFAKGCSRAPAGP